MKGSISLVVLSGISGCGKTTACTTTVALAKGRGLEVGGLLTLPRLVGGRKAGLDVEDARTGERRALAERIGPTDGPATGAWYFHAQGLAWGSQILAHATPCDLLVIDELGPLELNRGQGWQEGLEVLRAGHYRLALVVVRPSLVPRFQARLDRTALTLTVLEGNREALPGQIVALLGDKDDQGRAVERALRRAARAG